MKTTTKEIAKAIVEGYRASYAPDHVEDALDILRRELIDAHMALTASADWEQMEHRGQLLDQLAADIEDLVDDEKPEEITIRRIVKKEEWIEVTMADAIEHMSRSLQIPDDDHKTLNAWREQLAEGRALYTLSGVTYRRAM